MLSNSTRRWLAALGVAGAFVAASAVPAVAAPAVPLSDRAATEFGLYADNAIVATGGPAKLVRLDSLASEPLTSYTVKVDTSAVQSFAHVQLHPYNIGVCRADGPILSCTAENLELAGSRLFLLDVFARDTGKIGQHGELSFTVSTPHAGIGTVRSTVTIGEGVDLAGRALELKGAPGETVPARVTVTNVGGKTADGAVLFFLGPSPYVPSARYDNCEYRVEPAKWHAFACTFDSPLAPGATAVVDPSFGFTIPSDAWAPDRHEARARWLTVAEWQDFRDELDIVGHPRKGTGRTLKLTTQPDVRSTPQTDTAPQDNGGDMWLEVTGDQKADAAANGANITGTVGSTVPVTVGWTNNGPAVINTYGSLSLSVRALVKIPAGTYAAKVPDGCAAEGHTGGIYGEPTNIPGFRAYSCGHGTPRSKGEKDEFEFEIRIDKAGRLTGSVELPTGSGEGADLDPTNNTAEIVINASDGGSDNPSGGGDGSPGGDNNGDDGGTGGGGAGDGGTLPITGSATGLIAGIGALLLLAGAGGYLLARGRRTRFIA